MSQKSEKHACFEVVWAKYAREPSRSHAHNTHSWKRVISSKSTKATVKAVYQYYYGDISAVEKGEIADSILYQTLDVFFEILNHCSQNSSHGGHYSCKWRSSEMKTVVLQGSSSGLHFLICCTNCLQIFKYQPTCGYFFSIVPFRENFDSEVFL